MDFLDIKPLSVNDVWRGRRFKTPIYKEYEQDVMLLLPQFDVPTGKLLLELEWGFSSKASDVDNPIKPFIDILQKAYDFNDNRIYKLVVSKVDVNKGDEYISFKLTSI